jgi:hypothetical protein
LRSTARRASPSSRNTCARWRTPSTPRS